MITRTITINGTEKTQAIIACNHNPIAKLLQFTAAVISPTEYGYSIERGSVSIVTIQNDPAFPYNDPTPDYDNFMDAVAPAWSPNKVAGKYTEDDFFGYMDQLQNQ